MDPRQQRGLMIAALCKITKKDGQWVVPSQTGTGATYKVTPNRVNPTIRFALAQTLRLATRSASTSSRSNT